MTSQTSSHNTTTIKSIEVAELFGTHSYNLKNAQQDPEDNSLFLLYGENGAGKSTILKLIFHILNPEPFAGHRTFISKIPFKSLKISLNNKTTIEATKQDIFSTSSYKLKIESAKLKTPILWEWNPAEKQKKDPTYIKICKFLSNHGPSIFFLPDNRKIEEISALSSESRSFISWEQQMFINASHAEKSDSLEALVNEAISRMEAWFSQQALRDTNTGYTSVNTIYVKLLETIIKENGATQTSTGISSNKLREKLNSLNTRNTQFSKYGLTPELEIDKLSSLLAQAKTTDSSLLATVLQPYLDGHNARLDALATTQQTIDQFVLTIADFFVEKTLKFKLRDGLSIESSIGRNLKPEVLSSGEKQLLLLFCNVITARKDGTIFIIDEPEISLNVKWQRRLIKALLSCLSGVHAQIVMATHSIEILSQHENHIAPLVNILQKNKK